MLLISVRNSSVFFFYSAHAILFLFFVLYVHWYFRFLLLQSWLQFISRIAKKKKKKTRGDLSIKNKGSSHTLPPRRLWMGDMHAAYSWLNALLPVETKKSALIFFFLFEEKQVFLFWNWVDPLLKVTAECASLPIPEVPPTELWLCGSVPSGNSAMGYNQGYNKLFTQVNT